MLRLSALQQRCDSRQAVVHIDVSALKVEPKWYKVTQDRLAWTQLIATVRTWHLVQD